MSLKITDSVFFLIVLNTNNAKNYVAYHYISTLSTLNKFDLEIIPPAKEPVYKRTSFNWQNVRNPYLRKDNCQAYIFSNKMKKDLEALVPNSPDLRCAIDGSGRSAVAYHITDQVISNRKDAKENPCLWLYCALCKS